MRFFLGIALAFVLGGGPTYAQQTWFMAPPGPTVREVVSIRNYCAGEMCELMAGLVPQARFESDSRLNLMIVTAPRESMDRARRLLAVLDVPSAKAVVETQILLMEIEPSAYTLAADRWPRAIGVQLTERRLEFVNGVEIGPTPEVIIDFDQWIRNRPRSALRVWRTNSP